jgi:hypothetical protein
LKSCAIAGVWRKVGAPLLAYGGKDNAIINYGGHLLAIEIQWRMLVAIKKEWRKSDGHWKQWRKMAEAELLGDVTPSRAQLQMSFNGGTHAFLYPGPVSTGLMQPERDDW